MLIHRGALELARIAGDPDDGPKSHAYIQVEEDGTVTAVNYAVWMRMRAAVDQPSLFDSEELAGGGNDDGPFLLAAEVVRQFNAALKKKKLKKDMPEPNVVIRTQFDAKAEAKILMASSDGRVKRHFSLEPPEEGVVFPTITNVLANEPTSYVMLDVDVLTEVVGTLKACKASSVRFGFPTNPHAPLQFNASTKYGPISGVMLVITARPTEDEHD